MSSLLLFYLFQQGDPEDIDDHFIGDRFGFKGFQFFGRVQIKTLREKLKSNVAMSETPLANEIIEDEN